MIHGVEEANVVLGGLADVVARIAVLVRVESLASHWRAILPGWKSILTLDDRLAVDAHEVSAVLDSIPLESHHQALFVPAVRALELALLDVSLGTAHLLDQASNLAHGHVNCTSGREPFVIFNPPVFENALLVAKLDHEDLTQA